MKPLSILASETSSKEFFAGPFVGEFGHELFCWHGKLRRLAKEYNHTTISCIEGHECLYADFADRLIPYRPQLFIPDCSWNRGITQDYPTPSQGDYIGPNTQIVRFHDEAQDFVKLGDPAKAPKAYDFIFAARSTNKGNSAYRNWDHCKWDELATRLRQKNYSIASIGLSTMSYSSALTDNSLDIDLGSLADLISAGGLVLGPSSGPLHFASLCAADQLIWSGDNIEMNQTRYETLWNPFQAKVNFIAHPQWDPSVDEIYHKCMTWTEQRVE